LLSPEELIIISTLKNKHADSKNNDMLYELSEALQFKCYLSNAKYSENTISIVNMVHSYISSANEKNSLG
jgi:hypothetical protein